MSDVPVFTSPILEMIHRSTGKCTEWGLPLGRLGRRFLLNLIKQEEGDCLWIYNNEDCKVYPPSWAAAGIDLQKIYFVGSQNPITDLRPAFMDDLFSLIVIDRPERMPQGALAFVLKQARLNRQRVFILRDFFLKESMGNPLASYRLNCSYSLYQKQFRLQMVKGPRCQTYYFKGEDVFQSEWGA